ncbi:NADP oxidoreductase [Corynebacterium sp. 320]|uniref:NADPH-dependent F420 reductase n=1 Tax=Corynebacterium TaxID=1716 RepID=UPI00125CBF18|nr:MULTISPECIES: NAD(P)-binding domain-containing protein [Corynebacterium]KAB1504061.1 NADP oxidoreductase [Corynebacterium sp. 320]KAB1552840.1 NADP oxidoreductase [Corynebacterium sp. 321]KAB1553942.1 NADP oxidoreductase [Corynebacterium sp. 319]KAB3528197.1 NADP oxidoreductase [Corynebacterium sp. 250]KAB3540315.1 NADP oxidoreductase [Corynebacterium sp. 366]
MQNIGIIGSGAIGEAVARLAVQAGISVTIANSRGPESLRELVQELGENAHAGTVEDAAGYSDLVVLAVPLSAYEALPVEALRGKLVVSTGNYYPHRDGRIAALDSLEQTTAEHEKSLLPGVTIVKAFNNILAHHISALAHSTPRTALPLFSDDAAAHQKTSHLVQALGFDTVNGGGLGESWKAEPESGGYTQTYAADKEGFAENFWEDPGRVVTADELQGVLDASQRADVAARQF